MQDLAELIAFTRARLLEEKTRALATDDCPAGLEWLPRRRQQPKIRSRPFAVRRPTVYMPVAIDLSEQDMRHVVDHSPLRVIADVDAKLYAVDAVAEWLAQHRHSNTGYVLAQVILTALAHRYCQHPAFQQSWGLPQQRSTGLDVHEFGPSLGPHPLPARRPSRVIPPDAVAEMAKRYEAGETIAQLAESTGYLYSQVRAALMAVSVRFRRGRAPRS